PIEGATVFEIPHLPFHDSRLIWRLAHVRQYFHCSRRLRRVTLDKPDVVVGSEHLFLRAHWQRFPTVPWIYLPHSLVVAQEIDGCGLPPTMRWFARRLYYKLQCWALSQADCTMRFTEYACRALSHYYGTAVRSRFVVNP